MSELLPRLSSIGYQGFVIKKVGFTNSARSQKKGELFEIYFRYCMFDKNQNTA